MIITKLQKFYSPPRNLSAGNKLPTQFLKKPLCMDNLQPMSKIMKGLLSDKIKDYTVLGIDFLII